LILRDKILSGVVLYITTTETWDKLETQYERKNQHTIAKLISDIFHGIFVEGTPLKTQFNSMIQKSKNLEHILTDSLVVTAIIILLFNSYILLQQLLFITSDDKLSTDFIIQQTLIEECFCTRNIIKIALFTKKINWNNSSRVALKAKPISGDLENDSKKSM